MSCRPRDHAFGDHDRSLRRPEESERLSGRHGHRVVVSSRLPPDDATELARDADPGRARSRNVLGCSLVRALPALAKKDPSNRVRGVDRGEHRVPRARICRTGVARDPRAPHIFLRLPEMLLALPTRDAAGRCAPVTGHTELVPQRRPGAAAPRSLVREGSGSRRVRWRREACGPSRRATTT